MEIDKATGFLISNVPTSHRSRTRECHFPQPVMHAHCLLTQASGKAHPRSIQATSHVPSWWQVESFPAALTGAFSALTSEELHPFINPIWELLPC
jgi:hypothetical protein